MCYILHSVERNLKDLNTGTLLMDLKSQYEFLPNWILNSTYVQAKLLQLVFPFFLFLEKVTKSICKGPRISTAICTNLDDLENKSRVGGLTSLVKDLL